MSVIYYSFVEGIGCEGLRNNEKKYNFFKIIIGVFGKMTGFSKFF